MRSKMKEEKCKFIINEEKRKVVCVISNVTNDVHNLVYKVFSDIDFWWYQDHLKKKATLPKYFVGVATCSLEDEWDVEKGKKIAFYRAKYKYAVSYFKRANYVISELDKKVTELTDRFNTFGEKLEKSITKLEVELDDTLTFDTEN